MKQSETQQQKEKGRAGIQTKRDYIPLWTYINNIQFMWWLP